MTPLQWTNISTPKVCLKIIFLFPRWDMYSFPGGVNDGSSAVTAALQPLRALGLSYAKLQHLSQLMRDKVGNSKKKICASIKQFSSPLISLNPAIINIYFNSASFESQSGFTCSENPNPQLSRDSSWHKSSALDWESPPETRRKSLAETPLGIDAKVWHQGFPEKEVWCFRNLLLSLE